MEEQDFLALCDLCVSVPYPLSTIHNGEDIFGQFLTSLVSSAGRKPFKSYNYRRTLLAQKMLDDCHQDLFLT
jgi:hypothetical protein